MQQLTRYSQRQIFSHFIPGEGCRLDAVKQALNNNSPLEKRDIIAGFKHPDSEETCGYFCVHKYRFEGGVEVFLMPTSIPHSSRSRHETTYDQVFMRAPDLNHPNARKILSALEFLGYTGIEPSERWKPQYHSAREGR